MLGNKREILIKHKVFTRSRYIILKGVSVLKFTEKYTIKTLLLVNAMS